MSFLLDVRRMWAGRGRDEMSGVLSVSRVSLVTVWPSPSVSMGTHHTSHCPSHRCHINTGIKTCDTQLTNSHDPVTHENIGLCIQYSEKNLTGGQHLKIRAHTLSKLCQAFCFCIADVDWRYRRQDWQWPMMGHETGDSPPGRWWQTIPEPGTFITNNHSGIVNMVFTIFLKLICNYNPSAGESFLTKTQHCMASLKP